jgi:probable rRNA maturation factor
MRRFEVHVQNEANYAVDTARLMQAAHSVLKQQATNDGVLTIVITSNEAVQQLNQQYRQVDAPTDVLSFPADQLPPELAEDEDPYFGDVVIAYPYASEQAAREGHALNDSLALLVVHGTLHLLGYDHDTAENRATMWAAQAMALKALGIDEALVPALEGSEDA